MNKNKSNHKSTIIIATGGTGGHVAPALSIIDKLIEHNVIIITDIRGEAFFKKFLSWSVPRGTSWMRMVLICK